MDPDDQIVIQGRRHERMAKIFFKEDDAKGWLEHGDKKARNTKSKKTPNKNEDNKKAQKTKTKRQTNVAKSTRQSGLNLENGVVKELQNPRRIDIEPGQHFDSQEFLIEVLESLLPNHSFLNQLKMEELKIKIVNDETAILKESGRVTKYKTIG